MIYNHTDQIPLAILVGCMTAGISTFNPSVIISTYITFLIYTFIVWLVRRKRR